MKQAVVPFLHKHKVVGVIVRMIVVKVMYMEAVSQLFSEPLCASIGVRSKPCAVMWRHRALLSLRRRLLTQRADLVKFAHSLVLRSNALTSSLTQ